MKKKKIMLLCFSVIGGVFVLLNLAWLVFVCRCVQLQGKVEYNRITGAHQIQDYEENLIYVGFDLDDLFYLDFHAQAQLSMPFVDEEAADELQIHYTFLKGYSYTYLYYPEDRWSGGIPQGKCYELHFNEEMELLYEGDYERYEQYATRIQDLFEKADAVWGLQ